MNAFFGRTFTALGICVFLFAGCGTGSGDSDKSLSDLINDSSNVWLENNTYDEDVTVKSGTKNIGGANFSGRRITFLGGDINLNNIQNAELYISENVRRFSINNCKDISTVYVRGLAETISTNNGLYIFNSSIKNVNINAKDVNVYIDQGYDQTTTQTELSIESILLQKDGTQLNFSLQKSDTYIKELSLAGFSGGFTINNYQVFKPTFETISAENATSKSVAIINNTIQANNLKDADSKLGFYTNGISILGDAEPDIIARQVYINHVNFNHDGDYTFAYSAEKNQLDWYDFICSTIATNFYTQVPETFSFSIYFDNDSAITQPITTSNSYICSLQIPEDKSDIKFALNFNMNSYSQDFTEDWNYIPATITRLNDSVIPITVNGTLYNAEFGLYEGRKNQDVSFAVSADKVLQIKRNINNDYGSGFWNAWAMANIPNAADSEGKFDQNQNYKITLELRTDDTQKKPIQLEAYQPQKYVTPTSSWQSFSIETGSYAVPFYEMALDLAFGYMNAGSTLYVRNIVIEPSDQNNGYPLRCYVQNPNISVENGLTKDGGEDVYFTKFTSSSSKVEGVNWYADTKIIMSDTPIYDDRALLQFKAKIKAQKESEVFTGWVKAYESQHNRDASDMAYMWLNNSTVGTEWTEVTWYAINQFEMNPYSYPTACMAIAEPESNTFYMKDLSVQKIDNATSVLKYWATGELTDWEFKDITTTPLTITVDKKTEQNDYYMSGSLNVFMIPKDYEGSWAPGNLVPIVRNNLITTEYANGFYLYHSGDDPVFSILRNENSARTLTLTPQSDMTIKATCTE